MMEETQLLGGVIMILVSFDGRRLFAGNQDMPGIRSFAKRALYSSNRFKRFCSVSMGILL